MRILFAIAAVMGLSATPAAAQDAPVEVMVLGAYHFDSPGLDLINPEVDDVLAGRRQAELEALSAALAVWRPTRILVEAQRPGPGFEDERYRAFTAADLATDRNEIVQIGYRLARRLGHDAVYGFDEQPDEGEPDYFPFVALQQYAETHGQAGVIDALMTQARATVAEQTQGQAERGIAANLIAMNTPEAIRAGNGFYYGALAIGDGEAQRGAELNAYWYMRNAKMFAKIGLIAVPGDRVLVIVGAGHGFWLTHFAANTPGFVLVSPLPFLEVAASAR